MYVNWEILQENKSRKVELKQVRLVWAIKGNINYGFSVKETNLGTAKSQYVCYKLIYLFGQ